jgi:hypothetical protein
MGLIMKMIKISENESILPDSIAEISEVLEVRNRQKNFFCFTLVFRDQRILNLMREYRCGNRELIKLEINNLHKQLIDVRYKLINKS